MWTEATAEVEVEEEQGAAEQEVAVAEVEEAVEVAAEARLGDLQRQRAILAVRLGWSAREGTVAPVYWVVSLNRSYQLLSSLRSW